MKRRLMLALGIVATAVIAEGTAAYGAVKLPTQTRSLENMLRYDYAVDYDFGGDLSEAIPGLTDVDFDKDGKTDTVELSYDKEGNTICTVKFSKKDSISFEMPGRFPEWSCMVTYGDIYGDGINEILINGYTAGTGGYFIASSNILSQNEDGAWSEEDLSQESSYDLRDVVLTEKGVAWLFDKGEKLGATLTHKYFAEEVIVNPDYINDDADEDADEDAEQETPEEIAARIWPVDYAYGTKDISTQKISYESIAYYYGLDNGFEGDLGDIYDEYKNVDLDGDRKTDHILISKASDYDYEVTVKLGSGAELKTGESGYMGEPAVMVEHEDIDNDKKDEILIKIYAFSTAGPRITTSYLADMDSSKKWKLTEIDPYSVNEDIADLKATKDGIIALISEGMKDGAKNFYNYKAGSMKVAGGKLTFGTLTNELAQEMWPIDYNKTWENVDIYEGYFDKMYGEHLVDYDFEGDLAELFPELVNMDFNGDGETDTVSFSADDKKNTGIMTFVFSGEEEETVEIKDLDRAPNWGTVIKYGDVDHDFENEILVSGFVDGTGGYGITQAYILDYSKKNGWKVVKAYKYDVNNKLTDVKFTSTGIAFLYNMGEKNGAEMQNDYVGSIAELVNGSVKFESKKSAETANKIWYTTK